MTQTRRKLLRSAVSFYISRFPVQKGKGRLLYQLRPWLRAEGETAIARTCFGCDMELDLTDHVQEWIYFFGAYELPLVEYFRARLRHGMVFADVGAQVGQFTLLAAGAVGPQGHVHAFEPSPASFARLRRNIELNHFANITCHPLAVGDFTGEAQLYLQKQGPENRNTGTNSLRMKSDWNDADPVTVAVRPLDDVLSGLDRLDAMKVDVEGAELAVLRGAQKTLTKFRPLIAIEAEEASAQAFGYSTCELKACLKDLGYRLFRITREGKNSRLEAAHGVEVENFSMLIGLPPGVSSD